MTIHSQSRGACLVLAIALAGCGGATVEQAFGGSQAAPLKLRPDGSIDDRGQCEWRGRQDRDVVETAGPGSVTSNVRRVFAIVGQGIDRQRVLACREIDTNLDGTKDVFRKYNDKGESLFEEADTNHDGRVDTWLVFTKGRLAEEKLDSDFDGNPDEWKYYSGGQIVRAKRDTNKDSRPDIWEMYGSDGRLERMGVDVDGDERVDRWDFDSDVRKAKENKERAEEESAAQKANAKAEADKKAGEYAEADPNAPKEDPKKKKGLSNAEKKALKEKEAAEKAAADKAAKDKAATP